AVPGVKSFVQVPSGIAVVAEHFWAARLGRDALEIDWDFGPGAQLDTDRMREEFRALAATPGVRATAAGDVEAATRAAAKVVEADYELPYLAHATMEPMNCTAQVTPERVEVWLGTQNPESALAAAAEITGVAPENVYVHNCFLGGGFGRRSYSDDVKQAVTIAKAMGGKPVKMIWTREEDMRHDFYRPMAAIRFRAGLDAQGTPVAYFNRSVTHSILSRIRPDDIKNGIDR